MRLRRLLRKRSVVCSSLIGGIGNQMFQYAAGRALASHRGHQFVLDTSPLHIKATHTARTFELNAFNIRAEIDTLPTRSLDRLVVYAEPLIPKRWPMRVPRGVRLQGYYQNIDYFMGRRQELLADFTLRAVPGAQSQRISSAIKSAPASVSVHFRRGDYVTNADAAKMHGVCSPQYYSEALALVEAQCTDARYFVFSDDPEWVKAEARLPANTTLVDARQSTSHEDVWLMSLCKHHIVANSSFSWWGAWLSQHAGITVAPKRWYADAKAAMYERLVPSTWTRL